MEKKIKIKYRDAELPRLKYIGGEGKSNWIDLYAAETVTMFPGDYRLIDLGICVELPEGYEANIVPRSSTFKNFGIILVNSTGIIDHSYCGDEDWWKFPAYATKRVTIQKGDRICQFRINEIQPTVIFEEVEKLGNQNRGGIGSTGIKEDKAKIFSDGEITELELIAEGTEGTELLINHMANCKA